MNKKIDETAAVQIETDTAEGAQHTLREEAERKISELIA